MFKQVLILAAMFGINSEPKVPTVSYTSDSVITEGISYKKHESSTEDNVILEIVIDLPLGYKVYDDSSTAYIDGIKVNDNYLATDCLVEHYDETKDLTILVKTVYESGIAGMVASMQDGTYDYSQLLTNPIMIIQGVYYILSAISVIAGGVGVLKSKKYKSTTSEKWKNDANEVVKNTLTVAKDQTIAIVFNYFNTEILPILQQALTNDQKIVQAIAVQTSKDDKAPLTVLEILQDVSNNTNTTKIIEEAKKAIEEAKLSKQQALAETKKALKEISESVSTKETKESEGRY